MSGSYCPSPARHGTYPGYDKGRYSEDRYAERYKRAKLRRVIIADTPCLSPDDAPPEPDACTREVPPVKVNAAGGRLTTPRALLVLTLFCVVIGIGHVLFGHPATAVSFFLLSLVGAMATFTLRSAREGQWC